MPVPALFGTGIDSSTVENIMAQHLDTQNALDSRLVAEVPRRIAVGVDGFSTGDDAAALGSALAGASDADLILVAIHPDPIVVLPPELGWKGMHEQAQRMLSRTRRTLAPAGRTMVETDISTARALARVAQRERCDVLVLGSARGGATGQVTIGSATRQLLGHTACHLAIAPRGLSKAGPVDLRRIAVGYDGAPESRAALALAARLSLLTGAELRVVAVVDDRLPGFAWGAMQLGKTVAVWDEVLEEGRADLEREAQAATAWLEPAAVEVSAVFGSPAEILHQVSETTDLLVIGSRRWGVVARVLLGSTGEALLHGARCPVLVAARPVEE